MLFLTDILSWWEIVSNRERLKDREEWEKVKKDLKELQQRFRLCFVCNLLFMIQFSKYFIYSNFFYHLFFLFLFNLGSRRKKENTRI